MKTIITLLICLLLMPIAAAQYRCAENGKTLFTDRPCGSEVVTASPRERQPKIIGDSSNAAYSTAYGEWRGQIQYQATFNGQPIPEAHAVAQTTLVIEPQGKVAGISPENGCKIKGIATPGITQTMLNLDLSLSGCNYPKLNRRLFGSLTLHPAEKRAQLWVYVVPVDLFNPGYSYDIKGTMWR